MLSRQRKYIREILRHVYSKQQPWICITWPSFLLTCALLFITSTSKWVKKLHVSFVYNNCFGLFLAARFYFEKFSTWIWRLLFAVNVTLNLSFIIIMNGGKRQDSNVCRKTTFSCSLLPIFFVVPLQSLPSYARYSLNSVLTIWLTYRLPDCLIARSDWLSHWLPGLID